MSGEQDRPKPVAWAVITVGGAMVQKLYYSPPGDSELEYWDKESGWDRHAPHKRESLYPASAIKWWLERAARECEGLKMSNLPFLVQDAIYNKAIKDCAAAIRNLIGEVEP